MHCFSLVRFPNRFEQTDWELRVAKPIFSRESKNLREFPFIVGDHGVAEGHCLRGDKQVIRAYRPAGRFKLGTQQIVGRISGRFEGQNVKRAEHGNASEINRTGRQVGQGREILGEGLESRKHH